jgi:hypothetical protein
VTFADGAAVSKATLPGDFSTLTLTNVPAGTAPVTIVTFLERWTSHDFVEVVSLKSNPQSTTQSAEVRVLDGGRMSRAILSSTLKHKLNGTEIRISPVQLGSSESGTNRLQFSGVNCTWYNPSKTATLRFGPRYDIAKAVSAFRSQSRDLRGRRPIFDPISGAFAIRVGNLDCRTSVNDLRVFCNHYPPIGIEIGPKSHGMSPKDIQQQIRTLLESCGHIIEWIVSPQPGVAKVKAYVKFSTPTEAAQAAKVLDGSQIDSQYNDKLHVQQVVSVKLPVSQRVLEAIRPQLRVLSEASQSSDHVSIKAYDNALKAYTQIRVSGQDKTSVARAKMQVESLLVGNVAQDGTQPLTHPSFFQGTSTAFLNEVMAAHAVVIVQDRRKSILRLWGEEAQVTAAQEALKTRVANIESQTKEIILDPDTLVLAMRGGFQRMITLFGKEKVKLDITSDPKRILISGSDSDVKRARDTLDSSSSNLPEVIAGLTIGNDETSCCAVCWTPAEDPVRTSCGHVYCTTCFDSQATSTSDFPMACLGDAGVCNTPLTLQDLRRILASPTYDALLESALTKYIRTHPEVCS